MLSKGIYGHEFANKGGPFGLSCGQIRIREYVHNGGWYNKQGEKLGWGDLSIADIKRISEEIPKEELFVVLGEQDSFWRFVEHISMIGSICSTKPTAQAPGVDYVAEKARYIITRGNVYVVRRWVPVESGSFVERGLTFHAINEDEARDFFR